MKKKIIFLLFFILMIFMSISLVSAESISENEKDINKYETTENQTQDNTDMTNDSNKENEQDGFVDNIANAILDGVIVSPLRTFTNFAYTWFGDDIIGNFTELCFNFESQVIDEEVMNKIFNFIKDFSFSLVVLICLKNIFLNYVLWRGNTNENPLETVIGIAMCVAVIVGFNDIYGVFSELFKNFNKNIVNIMTEHSGFNFDSIVKTVLNNGRNAGQNIFLCLALLFEYMFFIYSFIATIMTGVEVMILKLGIPLASLSLLSSNMGNFQSYIKEFLKRFFLVIVKIFLLNFSLAILCSLGKGKSTFLTILSSATCLMVSMNADQFLAGLIGGASGGAVASLSGQYLKKLGGGVEKGAGKIRDFIKNKNKTEDEK